MKKYLINLDRSKDRLEQMKSEFRRYGLVFTRVAAVDGKELTQEELDAILDPIERWEIPIPPSEIGCFLSHKKCLQLIADSNDQYAAIFEDDIILSRHAQNILSDIGWIPEDADVVKLETFRTVILLGAARPIEGTKYEVGRLLSKHLCAGGYIVTREAAKRILLFMKQVSIPVDNLLFDPAYELFADLTIYQVNPALCRQEGLLSLIEADRKSLRRKHKVRPTLPGLILREILRAYNRSSHMLSPVKLWMRMTSKKRWLRVKFKN